MAKVHLTIASYIFVPTDDVDEALKKFIVRELQFFNPKIIELKRLGYSTWKVPKMVKCFSELKGGYVLPTGFGPRLRSFLQERGDEIVLEDKRMEKPVEKFNCKIKLKENQVPVVERALKLNRSIIEARPGFGKTMVGLYLMAARAQKTLIIVHTRALLTQWQKRLQENFDLAENELGMIGEGKWKIGDKVTVASYQTLLSRGTKQLKNEFGLVVVDECHHVPANTFTKVVRDFAAKYVLGLTATPFRKDRLDKLLVFYIGTIIKGADGGDIYGDGSQITDGLVDVGGGSAALFPQSAVEVVPTNLIVRATQLKIPDAEEKEFTELGTILGEDSARNQLIADDVVRVIKENKGARILVLSERVAHCENLYALIKKALPRQKIIFITGQVDKKERLKLFEQIKTNQYQIMVATGGVVGEGFDWPDLNTIFLTYPFSWRGKLIQYIGRVQRQVAGKESCQIYDYVDIENGMFKAMYRKRLRTYRELGVNLQTA